MIPPVSIRIANGCLVTFVFLALAVIAGFLVGYLP